MSPDITYTPHATIQYYSIYTYSMNKNLLNLQVFVSWFWKPSKLLHLLCILRNTAWFQQHENNQIVCKQPPNLYTLKTTPLWSIVSVVTSQGWQIHFRKQTSQL